MSFQQKTPEEEVARGGEARRIVESGLWAEACQRIDESLAAQRRSVPLREVEMHTRLIIAEQVWDQFKSFFKEVADSGRFADLQLQQQRSLKERIFRR